MQNPVIQRIKRRAEVCQSLPVTCGRRGNDTGNGMVTVGSIQCAVDCFPENGKSPHSKPVTSPLPPSAKCRLDVFFTLRPPYVRLHGGRIRNADRRAGQDPRTFEHQHDPPLRQIFRDGDRPRNGGSNTNMTRHYAKFSETVIGREMEAFGEKLASAAAEGDSGL